MSHGSEFVNNSDFASSSVVAKNSREACDFASSSVVAENSREARDCDEPKNSDLPSENNSHQPKKKSRLVWSTELHLRFLNAIKQIGLSRAVPKKILEVMNVSYLERTHVASHLQKYRKFLKAKSDKVIKRRPKDEKSLVCVNTSENSEPLGMGAYGRIPLQSLPSNRRPPLHPCTTGNMVPKRNQQYDPNIQLTNNFHTEQKLAHAPPLPPFPNTNTPHNFRQSMGTLDQASRYGVWPPSHTVLVENQSMLQRNNIHQSMMHPPPIHPINFQSSSMIFRENPFTQNHCFGMNVDHSLLPPQSSRNSVGFVQSQGGNNTNEAILSRFAAVYPHKNAGLQSAAVRSYAASMFDTQVPYDSASYFSNQHFSTNIVEKTINDT
ncbi:unnamed protein product [Sphenostylis stenocarpa]|uniref:Myb-like domain-containing protein n=1 Tax=Sphenostylis stenocarpa TaxID=92480 RepID=A0AA86VX49_9FABA|nr:unnamed protein product [Sphenostylis stenocarpa]